MLRAAPFKRCHHVVSHRPEKSCCMRDTQLCAMEKLQRFSLGEVFGQGEPAHSDGTLCSGPSWASSLLATELIRKAFFLGIAREGGKGACCSPGCIGEATSRCNKFLFLFIFSGHLVFFSIVLFFLSFFNITIWLLFAVFQCLKLASLLHNILCCENCRI